MRGQYYYDLTNQRPVFSRSRLLRAISAEDVSTKQSQQRGEAGVGRPGTSSEEAVIISGLAFSKRWLDLILFDKKIQYTMWIMKRLSWRMVRWLGLVDLTDWLDLNYNITSHYCINFWVGLKFECSRICKHIIKCIYLTHGLDYFPRFVRDLDHLFGCGVNDIK